MRFVGALASATLILDGINASLASMEKGFQELNQALAGENNRNLLASSLSDLANYGCWCYFDDKVGNGKGLPRDFIDEECRQLHRSYECAIAEIAGCIPYTVRNAAANTLVAAFNGDILQACTVLNNPQVVGNAADVPCAIASCAAETKFISNVQNYLLTEDALFSSLTHLGMKYNNGNSDGIFNPERECVAECPRGNCYSDKGDRQCCGVMPDRAPFKVHAGDVVLEQACCADKEVYTLATHSCTAGEVVKN
jgi:hypothetical protein